MKSICRQKWTWTLPWCDCSHYCFAPAELPYVSGYYRAREGGHLHDGMHEAAACAEVNSNRWGTDPMRRGPGKSEEDDCWMAIEQSPEQLQCMTVVLAATHHIPTINYNDSTVQRRKTRPPLAFIAGVNPCPWEPAPDAAAICSHRQRFILWCCGE